MLKKYSILFFIALCSLTAFAQGHKNLCITEVMVQSNDTINGKATGWVELYNSSYGTYAIEKVFITNKKADEIFKNKAYIDGAQKTEQVTSRDAILRYAADQSNSGVYEIPRGDERNTKVGPRMQVIFEADSNIAAGTYHLPFTLVPSKDNYLALYDVNGDLIDEVTVPATLPAGQSWALKAEGRLPWDIKSNKEFEIRDGSSVEKAITPGNFNTRDVNENIEKFHLGDPHGFIITLVGVGIVFCALLLLFILFKIFGMISDKSLNKGEKAPKAAPKAKEAPAAVEAAEANNDEEIVAICMALSQHFNAHDEESGVLTFKRDVFGSAWNLKTNLMRRLPIRR